MEPYKIYRCLVDACDGLVYVSEMDGDVAAYRSDGAPDMSCQLDFDEFMQRLIAQDAQWQQVYQIMADNLIDNKVCREGDIQVTYYVIGSASDGRTYGVTFEAVET